MPETQWRLLQFYSNYEPPKVTCMTSKKSQRKPSGNEMPLESRNHSGAAGCSGNADWTKDGNNFHNTARQRSKSNIPACQSKMKNKRATTCVAICIDERLIDEGCETQFSPFFAFIVSFAAV